jgi:hypothetical protein
MILPSTRYSQSALIETRTSPTSRALQPGIGTRLLEIMMAKAGEEEIRDEDFR